MSSLSRKDKAEFLEMVERIPDNQLRYFYLMLGSALADQTIPAPRRTQANTGPAQLADIQKRINR